MKSFPRLSPARSAVLAVTLLAVALGGSTQLWEQATVMLLAALVIFFAPPRHPLGSGPNLLLLALFLLALTAFLPAGLGLSAPWRNHLSHDLHMALPSFRTPQPWLTLQACAALFLALVWLAYVLGQGWTAEMRLLAARLLVFGVALLAGLAVAAFALKFHVPTWNQEQNRGWFPNRNQTADVLAVCAVVNYALIFDCLRRKKHSLYLWMITLVVLGAALIMSYSRAGVLMFFGGIALWHFWPVQGQRKEGRSLKWLALGLTFVFLLLSLFFLFGGDTLQRFAGPGGAAGSVQDNNFRLAIQKDALRFSTQSPFLGVGVGNFEPLFATARQASANGDRTIHPESDWLWAICELGWLAPVIFVGGIAWWLRACTPFQSKSGESLRRALTVAGVLFIAHSLVDVSGHRLGSFCVGIFVCSLALPTPPGTEAADWRKSAWAFRALALGMMLVAGWWLASSRNLAVPPTTAKLELLERRIDQAHAQNRLATMEDLATQALAIAPLNWHLYFQRACAETFEPGKLAAAALDFALARNLESKWVQPCFDEGATWLAADQPDLCIDAWTEALRRSDPADAPALYNEMVQLARTNEMVHDDLRQLAGKRAEYLLVFLDASSTDETNQIVNEILAQDPQLHGLNAAEQERLFTYWWTQGDRPALVAALAAHPDWQRAGWLYLAQSYAEQKDFQNAWAVVDRSAPAPPVPTVSSSVPLPELQSAFYDRDAGDNLATGILLYHAQLKEGRIEDALATLKMLEQAKSCPKYVYYLEAKLWAQKQDWELAWNAWWSYHEA